MKKILNLVNGIYHIYLYNDIGPWGFTAKELREELKSVKTTDKVVVHINSPGGSLFDSIAMFNILRQHAGEVETVCEGIAASAASVVFMAGKTRKIYDNAMLMIHAPFLGYTEGDADDLQKDADMLRNCEENIYRIYSSITGNSREKVATWCKEEKYFMAEEAKEEGFATEVIEVPETETRAAVDKLVAKLIQKGAPSMKYEIWLAAQCEELGLEVEKLTDKQKAAFKARFEGLPENRKPENRRSKSSPPPQENSEDDDQDGNSDIAVRNALELDRQASIEEVAATFGTDKLNADYLKGIGVTNCSTAKRLAIHAIKNRWTVDRFELECRRASVQDIGEHSVAIHSRNSRAFNPEAIACRLVRNAGVPAAAKTHGVGAQFGYEKWYNEQTLEASDAKHLQDLSLLQVFDMIYTQHTGHRYSGRLNTDGFLNAMRDVMRQIKMSGAGMTSHTGLDIFDDAANKMLLSAYNLQQTTWQEWVLQKPVNDFKTHNLYRLTMTGGYREVGGDGRLKHGSFVDDQYTHSAETYGKIVGLNRKHLINDDLGALNGIMVSLGMEAAGFLEELFYQHFQSQLTTLFPTGGGNANYISGAATALGVDALTTGMQKFMDQVTSDYAPIQMTPEILLVGTALKVVAGELYTQTSLDVLQTANTKGRPNNNPYVGMFRPVVSGYLNNTAIKQRISSPGTAISGQSSTQWFLLMKPNAAMGGIVIGSFLNGKTTPTINQHDADFDMLGLQWRAYHDAGADNGDPKLGVMSKGAA